MYAFMYGWISKFYDMWLLLIKPARIQTNRIYNQMALWPPTQSTGHTALISECMNIIIRWSFFSNTFWQISHRVRVTSTNPGIIHFTLMNFPEQRVSWLSVGTNKIKWVETQENIFFIYFLFLIQLSFIL